MDDLCFNNEQCLQVNELDESCKRYNPINLKIPLMNHQQTLLYRCLQLEKNKITIDLNGCKEEILTYDGILGDKVGSGKSFVILSLIMHHDKEPNNIKYQRVCVFNNGRVISLKQNNFTKANTNILVIPPLLRSQWRDNIKAFVPNDNKTIILNDKAQLYKFLNSDNLCNYKLIVMTQILYIEFANLLNSIQSPRILFSRIIFDEADTLKYTPPEINSEFRWFVTASLRDLKRKKTFQFNCNNENNDKIYNLLVVKNKDAYVQSSFHLPEPKINIVECFTPISIHLLNGIVDQRIISCLNGNDFKTALQLFGINQRRTETSIVSKILEEYIKTKSNASFALDSILSNKYRITKEQDKISEIGKYKKQIQEADEKIQNIKDRIASSNGCNICFEYPYLKTIPRCCFNIFCFKCLNMWIHSNCTCPICKKQLTIQQIFIVDDGNTLCDENLNILSKYNSKEKNLEILIDSINSKSKVLIFSSYENGYYHVCKFLNRNKIKYKFLKGNTYQLDKIIHSYKYGETQVLLINSTHNGNGLNLENTSDIIIYHKLDDEKRNQVIGRAQRIGRKTSLNIWYLLHENEL